MADKSLGVIHLEKTHKHKRNPKRCKRMNMTRNRLTKEDKSKIKYEMLSPLYEMWCEYYRNMTSEGRVKLDERMLKADYHGALLCVAEADNSTQIGIHGIVALETRHTFQLVTKDDKYVVIPKQGTTFQFVLDGRVFTIFGDAMRFKPSLRGKKQRLNSMLPLLLK